MAKTMKRAFTLIELIFIIVLIGIMSGVATSAFKEDRLSLAIYDTLEGIRYAQHMAITEHKFDPKDEGYKAKGGTPDGNFFREHWRIMFFKNASNEYGYTVWTDRNRNRTIDTGEISKDPLEKEPYNRNLSQKFEITNITFSGGCADTATTGYGATDNERIGSISFDEKGRPYIGITQTGAYQHRLLSECTITLTHADGTVGIKIYPETGYAEIAQ